MNDEAEQTYRLDDHAYLRWTPEPTTEQPCLVCGFGRPLGATDISRATVGSAHTSVSSFRFEARACRRCWHHYIAPALAFIVTGR